MDTGWQCVWIASLLPSNPIKLALSFLFYTTRVEAQGGCPGILPDSIIHGFLGYALPFPLVDASSQPFALAKPLKFAQPINPLALHYAKRRHRDSLTSHFCFNDKGARCMHVHTKHLVLCHTPGELPFRPRGPQRCQRKGPTQGLPPNLTLFIGLLSTRPFQPRGPFSTSPTNWSSEYSKPLSAQNRSPAVAQFPQD